MLYFNCDYNEGAHEAVMERLMETNREQTEGYGCDEYCRQAAELIRKECRAPKAAVHFLVGGTQTNTTVIAAALRSHQGVVAAVTGHVNVHETGAIEAVGHKVIALPSVDGKLTARQVEECCKEHWADESHEHIVQPKMVYISQPTELGTLYTLQELEELSAVCRRNNVFLYADGARLGYGLTAEGNNVELSDLARLCDVFYIGGTKVGALFGEAVVIINEVLQEDFRYLIKQKGGMLAKGRLLGLQFLVLFEQNRYREISAHAIALADRIRKILREKNVAFMVENNTNQIFPILPDDVLAQLNQRYCFSYMERIDQQHSAVRICTSWATDEKAAEQLCRDLERLL